MEERRHQNARNATAAKSATSAKPAATATAASKLNEKTDRERGSTQKANRKGKNSPDEIMVWSMFIVPAQEEFIVCELTDAQTSCV